MPWSRALEAEASDGRDRPPTTAWADTAVVRRQHPASGRLAEAVSSRLAPLAALMPEVHLRVERSPRTELGELRVRVLGESVTDCLPALSSAVAAHLRSAGVVAETTTIPPCVYLRIDLDLLRSTVVEAPERVRRDGQGASRGVALLSFSDPNLTKPLHLGHLRNNVLGMALLRLLERQGWQVETQADHNDWGLPLCQAAVGYLRWSAPATPESTAAKGDHFVGRCYTRFHDEAGSPQTGDAGLHAEAQQMLALIEQGDPSAVELSRRLAGWTEEGVAETYRRIGTRFDRVFHGSDYVDPGNRMVHAALASGVMVRRPDQSVYLDLDTDGIGAVTVVRQDGTPLFLRQWLAMDIDRFGGRPFDRAVLLSGREWRPAFATYNAALRRLGHPWVERVESIHYGMVNLPKGRMSSRGGTVLCIDDLIEATAVSLAARRPPPPDPEALAVAVLAWHFLRHDREADVLFDEADLELRSVEEMLRQAALLEGSGSENRPGRARTKDGEPALRELLVLVDRLTEVSAAAADDLEPARVVRHLLRIAELTTRTLERGWLDEATSRSVAAATERGLTSINIQLGSPTR